MDDYSTRFSTEFINALKSQNRRSKNWDDMSMSQRANYIKNVKSKIIHDQMRKDTPFFKAILEKIQDTIIYSNMDTIHEYLLNLTGMMDSYLYDAIHSRFDIMEIDMNDVARSYSSKLGDIFNNSNFFNKHQSQDLAILIELINVASTYDDNLTNLCFYTNDETFRQIIEKIKDNNLDIEDNLVRQYFTNNFDKIVSKPFQ